MKFCNDKLEDFIQCEHEIVSKKDAKIKNLREGMIKIVKS